MDLLKTGRTHFGRIANRGLGRPLEQFMELGEVPSLLTFSASLYTDCVFCRVIEGFLEYLFLLGQSQFYDLAQVQIGFCISF